jgi:superfamily II DNA or RNA helicase
MNALDTLYPYQKETVSQAFFHNKGIMCLPTGTGKTYCQAAILAHDISLNIDQYRTYVVNAPRILLTYQLLKEVCGYLVSHGIEARYMFVHSGGTSDERELELMRTNANAEGNDIPFSQIISGTNPAVIQDMMLTARDQSLPLIIFSTYNSADKIEVARQMVSRQPISIVLNDEAHYLVQEQFHNILTTLTSSRCYFFTATTIHTPSDKGRGMNNKELYGDILFKMTPREAIDLGKMVRPRLHVIRTSSDDYHSEDYNRSLNKIIKEGYEQHCHVLKDVKGKMLVSVKGTNDMLRFLDSQECRELKEDGVRIYAVASNEDIGNNVNGDKVTRQQFLRQLKKDGLDKNSKLVILHYDILAEGIDVSGFTGIMPMRALSKSKFLQTFGRSARLDVLDRKNIDNGVITPDEVEKMLKPYAYVIIPNIIHDNEDDRTNISSLIGELRDYNFNPSEDIVSSSIVNGVPEVDELEGLNAIVRRLPIVGEIIEHLEAEIESEENAKLSTLEFLRKEIG